MSLYAKTSERLPSTPTLRDFGHNLIKFFPGSCLIADLSSKDNKIE
jgi:hypothetical protein